MKRSKGNIIIFSRTVQSGKTGQLMQFVKNKTAIAGILTPDVNGRRMMYDIKADAYFPFEIDQDDARPSQSIGRFSFLDAAFDHGIDILKSSIDSEWIVIDEVGRLEVELNKGFEAAIIELIAKCKLENTFNLLLVVRDSLVQKAIEKYQLQEATLIDHL